MQSFVWLVGAAVAAAALASFHRLQVRAMRAMAAGAPPPPPARHPTVTVVRPIKGLDPDLDANVRAGLAHDYPAEVETLFVFDDDREPGVPVVQKAIAEHRDAGHPGEARILFCGAPPSGRTGKLNAMLQGVRRARGEVIAFCDSDVRHDRHALRVLVETLLASPGAGSSFAPVVVSEPARTLGDAVCAMLLNGLYTPSAALALERRGGDLPFILGQFMAFTRDSLRAIGGLENAGGQLVDDLYIGALVERAGLRNVAAPHPVRIVQYGLGWRQAIRQYSRWMTFSRTGIPQWSFKLPIVAKALAFFAGLVAAAAAPGALPALAWLGVAGGALASVDLLHARTGCAPLRPRHWLAPAAIFVLAPLVFASIHLLQRRVDWRGRVYELDRSARLATDG